MLEMSFLFDKVFILSGNHEFDLDKYKTIEHTEAQIQNICSMRNNLFYLQKSQQLIDPVENISIAGCTLFSELPKAKYHHHVDHSLWLQNTVKNNPNISYIIATHHCPHIRLINGVYNKFLPKYFSSDQSKTFKNNNVIMWIFGHTHSNININLHNTFFTTNQYGIHKKPMKHFY